jgi:tyrosyl-tRNA synthetase
MTTTPDPGLLDDLRWRALLQDTTDAQTLAADLRAEPVTFYCGFDPTGPSLHVGHLLQALTMRRLQMAGHRPLALVGGATGLIGDPKPTAERSLVDQQTAAGWAARLRGQLERYFDFEGATAARLVDNLEWTAGLSTIDFLRDVGKHFSVNRMLDRDAVARRLDSSSGLSFTEFSYVLLQAHDYLQLFRRYGCRLQLGGSDQWGNITAGVDLVRRVEQTHVHAVTTPLLVKADGTKYGKTEGGTVWLDPALTSPYAFHQYWFNVDDGDVGGLLRRLTFLEHERIEALEQAVRESPAAREAQRALAAEVTGLVHGRDAVHQAETAAAALFGAASLAEVDAATLEQALGTVPHAQVPADARPSLADLVVATGLVASKGAARRTAAEGGLYVNNVRVTDADDAVGPADLLHGRWLVLRRGRRTVAGVDVLAAGALPGEPTPI